MSVLAGPPAGHPVELPGRGTTWVIESGPTGRLAGDAARRKPSRVEPKPPRRGSRSRHEGPDLGSRWPSGAGTSRHESPVPGSQDEGEAADAEQPEDGNPPAVVLLHGWSSSAALTWSASLPVLSRANKVVAMDVRGHGRGIHNSGPFHLDDCADDVAALVETMQLGPVTVVGYSMGGPIAQLVWRRHPEVVNSLVLCATAASFGGHPELAGALGVVGDGLLSLFGALPGPLRREAIRRFVRARTPGIEPWVVEEYTSLELRALVGAAIELNRFDARPWLPCVDVPTAVVVTTKDRTVSPSRQWELVNLIPGAIAFTVEADHRACATPGEFTPVLAEAIRAVQRQPAAAAGPG